MYLEYWGLSEHPFSNVPDPDFYFEEHKSVNDSINNVVSALAEGKDVFAALIGPYGIGKTMCMRMILERIDRSAYSIAFVTNPDMTFPQFLAEIIGQLDGRPCDIVDHDKLIEYFEALAIRIHKNNKRPLLFIDEGDTLKPHNFENIYLLINILRDREAPFSLILASHPETEERLKDHKGTNLLETIDQYCLLHGLNSREILHKYIDHRMRKAGYKSDKEIFSPEAIAALWSISNGGRPRTVNKVCTLSLRLGETDALEQLDGKTVSKAGTIFMRANLPSLQMKTSSMPDIQPLAEHSNAPGITEEPGDTADPPKKDSASYEIKPEISDTEAPDNVKIRQKRLKPEKQPLSLKELEELASRLATERIKSRKDMSDTFEAWEELRNDILLQLKKTRSATTN